MKLSNSKESDVLLRLIPLVDRSDEISLRITELMTQGKLLGTEGSSLSAERDAIAVEAGRLLGDDGTDNSSRTSIWRARAVIAGE